MGFPALKFLYLSLIRQNGSSVLGVRKRPAITKLTDITVAASPSCPVIPRSRRVRLYAKLVEPLVVSLSNHEPDRSSFDRPVLSERLILRQAQDERQVEGLRTSECVEPSEATREYYRAAERLTDPTGSDRSRARDAQYRARATARFVRGTSAASTRQDPQVAHRRGVADRSGRRRHLLREE